MSASQITWLFFGFRGRISRLAFLLGGLLMVVVTLFALYRLSIAMEIGRGVEFWNAFLFVVVMLSLWCQTALGVKRLHDLGRPGLLALGLLIPFINFMGFVALCVWPGDAGANRYGPVTNRPA